VTAAGTDRRWFGIQRTELRAALWAFLFFFSLLAGYYVLRPIRDEMAIQGGQAELSRLFTMVLVSMLVLVPIFGWLTSRFPRKQLLPWLYAFFVANLVGFYFAFSVEGTQAKPLATTFFVWVSVFNLFAVSLFWSFMADLFDTGQAKRLYGFIAAGGTTGALTGPSLTALFVTVVGAKGMLLVSAGFLALAIVAILRLRAWAEATGAQGATKHEAALGGSVWDGLKDVVRSPYLLGICVFLLGYSLLSTFLYFAQTELVPAYISNSAERTRLLALVDLSVNVLTLFVQVFAFRTVIQKLGTTFSLAAMPVVAVVGFAALALNPVLSVLVVFGVIRRAGEYAISRPARETLYNVLPADQKYKAKNVIDTVVHRGGDTASSWIFNGLRALGMSLTTMAWIAVPVSALWWLSAVLLGRNAARRQAQAAVVDSTGTAGVSLAANVSR
jgi:AAA family ATP:ADP antiporter